MMHVAETTTKGGFALVLTLIAVVLLTIMAVAFLSSASLEQATARATAHAAKADLAARTAVSTAIARLVDNLSVYPDSATTWETINGNSGTVLYYHDKTPEQNLSHANLYVFPLASGGLAMLATEKTSSLPTLDDTNSFDLNHARYLNDLQGWIGAPVGISSRPEFRGQWIEQTDLDSKVTSRYAYWVEDESFKANANLMGKAPRGAASLGVSPNEIPWQGILKALFPLRTDFDLIASDIVSARSQFASSLFYGYRQINNIAAQDSTYDFSILADGAKFETTLYSGATNLSRSGSRRINLNKVIRTSADAHEIRTQLDEIISAITYHTPNFAQRFYRTGANKNSLDVDGAGSPSNQAIYLNKIAANIRDYVDTDSQPTIVNNDADLTVNIGSAPAHSLPGGGASGRNEVAAVGKEAVPFIQEYLLRVKQDIFSNRLGASATYKLEIDHYLEVWNMSDKDITVAQLGSNPFLRIANQFGWDAGGASDIPESPSRDFSIPLSSLTNSSGTPLFFPAGTATVLTTDPSPLPSTFPGVDASRVFRPPAGMPADSVRIYDGTTQKKSGSNLRINSIPRPNNSPTSADLETEVILGNDSGVLESFGAPAAYYITANVDDGSSNADSIHADTAQYYFRASSLKGNASGATPSQVGDPRTNDEQLATTTSTADDDQTAYKLEAWNSPAQIPNTTLTKLNANYVNPGLWNDFATNTADAAHAPTVVANGALVSIGQLGDIFEPVRSIGVSGTIDYSRGGGRTFKIGQPDDLWDKNSKSPSREWTAWRLLDYFTTTDSLQLEGRINVNGVNRDGGSALKATLYGYSFEASPDSDPTIASQALTDPQIESLIAQIQSRLNNEAPFSLTVGPLFERGEVSEMPIFNTGTLLTGHDMASVYDRGREEIFRRLAELITTRGNIFSVYAVGQSLIPPPAGSTAPALVAATVQLKVTFRIDPVWSGGTPVDPFDPKRTTRFLRPDSYAIKVLYAGQ